MTDLDLAAIKARADAATPGPWRRERDWYVWSDAVTPNAEMNGYEGTPIFDTFMWTDQGDANADFTAHAREDVPALLEALRVKTVEVAALREQIAKRDVLSEAQVEAGARAMFEAGGLDDGDYSWADMLRDDPSRAELWRNDVRQVLEAAKGADE